MRFRRFLSSVHFERSSSSKDPRSKVLTPKENYMYKVINVNIVNIIIVVKEKTEYFHANTLRKIFDNYIIKFYYRQNLTSKNTIFSI